MKEQLETVKQVNALIHNENQKFADAANSYLAGEIDLRAFASRSQAWAECLKLSIETYFTGKIDHAE